MRAVEISDARVRPTSCAWSSATAPGAGRRRGAGARWRRPASTGPTCCSGAAATRRRPARRTCPGSRSPATSPRSVRRLDGRAGALARGRRRVRAGRRRRLRRVLRGAGGAVPAGAGRAARWSRRRRMPETFFTVWTNVFERGRLQRGRVAPGARRLERHRHHRDPAGAARSARGCSPPPGRRPSARPACALGAEIAVNYREQRLGRGAARGHRRPRRRRDPRHGRRRLRGRAT